MNTCTSEDTMSTSSVCLFPVTSSVFSSLAALVRKIFKPCLDWPSRHALRNLSASSCRVANAATNCCCGGCWWFGCCRIAGRSTFLATSSTAPGADGVAEDLRSLDIAHACLGLVGRRCSSDSCRRKGGAAGRPTFWCRESWRLSRGRRGHTPLCICIVVSAIRSRRLVSHWETINRRDWWLNTLLI